MSRRILFALIASMAIGCGLFGVRAYALHDWQLSARLFGLGTLLGSFVSIAQLIKDRNKSNA
jgi:hypothetical protein